MLPRLSVQGVVPGAEAWYRQETVKLQNLGSQPRHTQSESALQEIPETSRNAKVWGTPLWYSDVSNLRPHPRA